MNIREAVAKIIGDDLAEAIIADKGMHWAVVAAMTEATTDDDPVALAAIRAWNAEEKALREILGDALRANNKH